MRRRVIALFLALLFCIPVCMAEQRTVNARFPATQIVKMFHKNTRQNNGSIIDAFYPTTSNKHVTDDVRSLINGYISSIAPTLPAGKKTPEDSKLFIRCVYSPTGESWLSFHVLARIVFHREQLHVESATRTYDMASGKQISLTDIFPSGSPAWDLLAKTVQEQLTAYYKEEPDQEALNTLISRDSLEKASFTLEPIKLTLHYPASLLYPNRNTMMHVVVYYSDLQGMMTPEAARQTDNSSRPMIALTFDDGPRYAGTVNLLDELQSYGARATFFLIGDQMEGNRDVVQREHDEGHTIASHTWNHYNPRNLTVQQLFENKEQFDLLLSDIIGLDASFMRAPGGRYQEFVEAGIGLPLIQWSVIGGDITAKSRSLILNTVPGKAKHGSIILLHDTKRLTVKTIRAVLAVLRKKGIFCVTVEDLFHQNGIDMQPNVVYRDANGWIEEY